MIRALLVLGLTLASCAMAQPPLVAGSIFEPVEDVVYISVDLRSVLVFSRQGTRFGDFNALWPGLWPSHRAELVQPAAGVQCVLIGPRESAVELAVKRPIRMGDRYNCLRSRFRVTHCFNDCHAAIVEIEAPASGNDPTRSPLKHYMYVDRCLGMLAYSVIGDMGGSIPFDAMWLRGDVGVLGDLENPACDRD